EHALVKPVNLLIIPIFAFANTNITLEDSMIQGLTSSLGLGIALGLVLGKPIGIMLIAFLCRKLKLSELPENANWRHILGVGLLAGIGFTMSIFIALLSFESETHIAEAKLAILITSLLAGVLGFIILRASSVKNQS